MLIYDKLIINSFKQARITARPTEYYKDSCMRDLLVKQAQSRRELNKCTVFDYNYLIIKLIIKKSYGILILQSVLHNNITKYVGSQNTKKMIEKLHLAIN